MQVKKKKEYETPYLYCTDKKGKLKFKAFLYEDGGGEYQLWENNEVYDCESSGDIGDWIKKVQHAKKMFTALEHFLLDLEEVYKTADFKNK